MSGERYIRDEYAKIVNRYPMEGGNVLETYSVYRDDFDWGDDKPVFHPFEDTVLYRMHVRGFTKHSSSHVENKGCYAGIVEKIPYLKELGITSVELMPAYEFDDYLVADQAKKIRNYWGYGTAYYFAPKASFSRKGKGTQVNEFKQMVKELHKNGIEVIMEFHFVDGMSPHTIMDALRFWVLNYHIDGIHANFNVAPLNMIKSDPLISMVKIIENYVSGENIDDYYLFENSRRFAVLNEGFLPDERRFIKSDDGLVMAMMEQIRTNPQKYARINYLSNHNTMSLMDSVSYERKHNEDNGEFNMDGTDYNYSWNCGVEGPSRKKKIVKARRRQMENSISLLLLSQGTPMLYAGDEMGKSCRGNNNPYCQDNEVSWLNWNDLKTNHEIFEFTKKMIAFRKNHTILHQADEPTQMDTISCGCPDLSYHGTEPWKVDVTYNSRSFAFLYNGSFGREQEEDVYVACNMHWDMRQFAVPFIDKKKQWKLFCATEEGVQEEFKDKEIQRILTVMPRSICILVGTEREEK
jgi:glycogen operon protein